MEPAMKTTQVIKIFTLLAFTALLVSCCPKRGGCLNECGAGNIVEDIYEGGPVTEGLTVKDGRLYKDGKPYRGIGLNYFTALTRTTGLEGMPSKLSDASYRYGFEILKEYDIPFVRIAAGGFYPIDWRLYKEDKHAYFKAFDRLVADAEEYGIGLIPSLFWYYPTIPDVFEEHVSELGNPNSQSIAFIRKYTREVVYRYKDSPAIWAWEFGNEYIHEADLPQPELGRGWLVPEFGTPQQRTDEDKLYRKHVYNAHRAFADTIRLFDKRRPIISGDTLPRFSAYNNHYNNSWAADTSEQWKQMLLQDNQYMDTISVHIYHYDPNAKYQDGGIKGMPMDNQIAFLTDVSHEIGKPLIIGEFGPSNRQRPVEQEREEFEEVLEAIIENDVPLAALWNFDFVHEDQMIWNIQKDNHRVYMLEAIQAANKQISEKLN
jgi:hypothetical protein